MSETVGERAVSADLASRDSKHGGDRKSDAYSADVPNKPTVGEAAEQAKIGESTVREVRHLRETAADPDAPDAIRLEAAKQYLLVASGTKSVRAACLAMDSAHSPYGQALSPVLHGHSELLDSLHRCFAETLSPFCRPDHLTGYVYVFWWVCSDSVPVYVGMTTQRRVVKRWGDYGGYNRRIRGLVKEHGDPEPALLMRVTEHARCETELIAAVGRLALTYPVIDLLNSG